MTHSPPQSTDLSYRLQPFIDKMKGAALPDDLIDTFSHYYGLVVSGQQGLIAEREIVPVQAASIPHLDELDNFTEPGVKLLKNTAQLKLNGGLGTTMGCSGPKSLIPITRQKSFLDIIIENLSWVNAQYQTRIPLILMNSFYTDKQTQDFLAKAELSAGECTHTFLQHKFPKVDKATLTPASYPAYPEMEWNPPGHGDLYLALHTSGMLDKLLADNINYLFISNSDNLGAHIDPRIPGFMESNNCPFLMEVAQRLETDQKGGHIARLHTGQLILREIRQCPSSDLADFQNIQKHSFFNTNNIWIKLDALKSLLAQKKGVLDLPLICNQKKVNTLDPSSSDVYQLESAMGAALSVFPNATVLHVPRKRFFPVKTCDDLLLLQSDFFHLSENGTFEPMQNCPTSFPVIKLDPAYFHTVDLLKQHFPFGAPSLKHASVFKITGNVYFENNVIIEGAITISNTSPTPLIIKENQIIQSDIKI